MDTYKYENASYTRAELIYDKERLLKNHAKGQSPYSIAP
jgi:formate hydrogenlyase subunit 6/NADH:ubiquinone oxidoreductase subunit I